MTAENSGKGNFKRHICWSRLFFNSWTAAAGRKRGFSFIYFEIKTLKRPRATTLQLSIRLYQKTLSYVNKATKADRWHGGAFKCLSDCHVNMLDRLRTSSNRTTDKKKKYSDDNGGTNDGRSVTYRWTAGHTGRPAEKEEAVLSRNGTFLQS